MSLVEKTKDETGFVYNINSSLTIKNNNMNSKTLIIGGTSGIGLETARIACSLGEVIILGRDVSKIADDPTLEGSIKLSFDISQKDKRNELIKELKKHKITKIVHCAGIFRTKNENINEYKKEYKAVKYGGITIIERIVKTNSVNQKVTHVCVVSSLYTRISGFPELVPFFEKRVNQKLEKRAMKIKGVIINCIAPGLTRTPLAEKAFGGEKGMLELLKFAPGSRIVEPKEVAEKINYLLSQNKIKGKIIPVDGDFLAFLKKQY